MNMDAFTDTGVVDDTEKLTAENTDCIGPYYGLREEFENGDIYEGITTGCGLFRDASLLEWSERLSFVAEKSRISGEFRVSIRSKSLQQKFIDLILWNGSELNFDWQNTSLSWFSNHYRYFKDQRNACNLFGTTSFETKELQLFIQDFLLLNETFDGFNFEEMYASGKLSADHWQDIQNAAALKDIDELDQVFMSCAAAHDEMSDDIETLVVGIGAWNNADRIEASPIDALLAEDTITECSLPQPNSDLIFPKTLENLPAQTPCTAYQLRIASENGDISSVWSLLRNGAPATSICSHVTTFERSGKLDLTRVPLVAAAQKGHIRVVQHLIEYGASKIQWHGQAAMREAAAEGYLDVVQTLMTSGVDVDAETCWGRQTVLEAAVTGGHEQIVRLILERAHPTAASLRRSLIAAAEDRCTATRTGLDCDQRNEIHNTLRAYVFGRLRMYPEAIMESEKCKSLPTRVHQSFKDLHTQLMSLRWNWKCHGICACASCPRKWYLQTIRYTDAWKQGITVIKRLLRNNLPRSLGEVISCILVALATGQQLEKRDGVDTTSENFHILKDLYRWREHLSAEEIEIFDDIIGQMWGLGGRKGLFEMVPIFENLEPVPSDQQDLLYKLQAMVSSLISGTGARYVSNQDYTPFGTPLRKIYERYRNTHDTVEFANEDRGHGMFSGYNVRADKGITKEPPPLESWWHATLNLPKICLLFAGAIFGMILAFLMIFRTGAEAPPIPQDSVFSQFTDSRGQNTLAQNCYLLVLYLGLSVTSVRKSNDGAEVELAADELCRDTQGSFPQFSNMEDSNIHLPEWSGSADPDHAYGIGMSTWSLNDDNASYGNGSSFQTDENCIELHTGFQTNVTPATATPLYQPPEADLTCPRCSKSYTTSSNYTKHVKYHCDMILKQRYRCRNSPCQKASNDPYYRKRHEEKHCAYRNSLQAGGS